VVLNSRGIEHGDVGKPARPQRAMITVPQDRPMRLTLGMPRSRRK
jgi:hypothetical protein